MKKVILLTAMFIEIVMLSYGQEVIPFAWKDKKALVIDKKNLPNLLDRTWTIYRHYEIQKDTVRLRTTGFTVFKFVVNESFQGMTGNITLSGGWKIQGKKTLILMMPDTNSIKYGVIEKGSYVIYKINEEELILAKKSPNERAIRILLYCKGTKSNVFAEPYKPNVLTQAVKVDAETLKTNREKREKATLITEIQTEMMLRHVKSRQKLENLDIKMLQVIKKQVLSGDYQKEKIKG